MERNELLEWHMIPIEDIDKYYNSTAQCKNCLHGYLIGIPKGVFRTSMIWTCKRCGCTAVRA